MSRLGQFLSCSEICYLAEDHVALFLEFRYQGTEDVLLRIDEHSRASIGESCTFTYDHEDVLAVLVLALADEFG